MRVTCGHELTAWSRGTNPHQERAAVRQGKLPPKDLSKMMPERHQHPYVATSVGRPVDLMNNARKGLNHPPVQRPVTDDLAMQGRVGHMLPEHVAIMQIAANKNWEQIGMDVPVRLRELEDPERHQRLKEEAYSTPPNRGVGA